MLSGVCLEQNPTGCQCCRRSKLPAQPLGGEPCGGCASEAAGQAGDASQGICTAKAAVGWLSWAGAAAGPSAAEGALGQLRGWHRAAEGAADTSAAEV